MQVTRRWAALFIGAAPVAAPKMVKDTLAQKLELDAKLAARNPAVGDGSTSGSILASDSGAAMPRWKAARLIFRNSSRARNIMESSYYGYLRRSGIGTVIDPDIMVYRSFSPMFKVTLQRQRVVARLMEESTNSHDKFYPYDILDKMTHFLMYGRSYRED